jgi:ATP-dependent DNA helicase RecG
MESTHMNWSDALGRIRQGEGLSTEFKQELTSPDRLAASLVAFANSSGGVIFVGVDDNGAPVGVDDVDAAVRLVDSVAANNCRPTITVVPEVVYPEPSGASERHLPIIALHVAKGSMRPYSTNKGRYYIRTGSGRRDASREELLRIFQDVGDIYYDETPLQWLSLADLDMDSIQHFIQTYRPDLAEAETLLLMRNWGLLRGAHPTVAGALLFARTPQLHIPHASVIAARFPGVDSASAPLDLKEIHGRMISLIDQTLSFLHIHLPTLHEVAGVGSELRPSIPPVVLREAVVNALVHRDYTAHGPVRVFVFADRLEVRNPGKPPNTVDEGAMRAGVHIVRNPRLYSRLADAGLVTNAGTGIRRMIATIRDVLGRELAINIIESETSLIIPRGDYSAGRDQSH